MTAPAGECVPDAQGRSLWLVGERDRDGKTDNFLALHHLGEDGMEQPKVVASGRFLPQAPPQARTVDASPTSPGTRGDALGRRRALSPTANGRRAAGRRSRRRSRGQGTSVFQPAWDPEGALLSWTTARGGGIFTSKPRLARSPRRAYPGPRNSASPLAARHAELVFYR